MVITSSFPTSLSNVYERIEQIDPIRYGQTRNYLDGAVTRLSPYISRGVISTKKVMQHILAKGYPLAKAEKLLQELAWRDYWQQVWIAKGDAINTDLKNSQPDVLQQGMIKAIAEAHTGIKAIDEGILELYETGYMHNHMRMYVASVTTNVARCHWLWPARWMYYHLLDGDWASNALSWQWVAGANSHKKYYANQENINRYCRTLQSETFLDVPYERFDTMEVPNVFNAVYIPNFTTLLPGQELLRIDPSLPLCIYNSYNLDPEWRQQQACNRVLLLEPSHFEKYPVSPKVLQFILELSRNISGIQVFVGTFSELIKACPSPEIYYKEHPLNKHYRGHQDAREWMFDVHGYFPSFFSYWKKCEKQLKAIYYSN